MSILQPVKNWYIINVHVGHEEKVAEQIKQRADSLDLADKIFGTLVPKEKQVEVKNGKKRYCKLGRLLKLGILPFSWLVPRESTCKLGRLVKLGILPLS